MRALALALALTLSGCTGGSDGADREDAGTADADASGLDDGGEGQDGGGDAGDVLDAGTTCGDPAITARYEECRAAANRHDEAACVAAGGRWARIGLATEPDCVCPTGQGACPCTRAEDCLSSSCRAQPQGGLTNCPMTEGRCASESPFVGCWCLIDDGRADAICID